MQKRAALPLLVVATLAAFGRPTPAADIPNDRESVEHALRRLTFGPRPSDVDRVREMGLATWIDRQLNPSAIDDTALVPRLPAMPSRPAQIADPREARQFGRQSVQALSSAKLVRAIHSERQLDEVLVDFWFNHFNVFAGKGRTSNFIPDYEREAIRPHVLGRFRDLLGATAKSPAMLFYLDNWLSADPEAAERTNQMRQQRQQQPQRQQRQQPQRQQRQQARRPAVAAGAEVPDQAGQAPPPQNQPNRRRGLNENYARELLELHTLGVDGGYTQDDIINVARAFTGWTIDRPDGASGFRFAAMLHDTDEKVILGQRFKAGGGIDEGERVLDLLAAHPSTATHIATKLARRFVSDNPPEGLVARVAARFRETDGNLRETVRAVITSPEFFAAEARRAKVKTPLEFVVSAVRTTGRDVGDGRQLLQGLRQLGMAPYMAEPPTGYADEAEAWISAGALVSRMNIAQQIAGPQAATVGGPEFQRR
jgi:uncharacterized protein (DUF1800 family)